MTGHPDQRLDAAVEQLAGSAEELVRLTLELSELPDLAGHELPVAEYVADWARAHRFPVVLQPIGPESANVIITAAEPPAGAVPALTLNAHLDTEGGPPSDAADADSLRGAHRDGDLLIGKGLVNDRIQLVAQLLAARALVDHDVDLSGGLLVAGVAQETGGPLSTDPPGRGSALDEPPHHGEGSGTRALLEAGFVSRRAIVGEPNGFAVGGAECGFLRVRIDVFGRMDYTPFLQRGPSGANAYEAAGHVVTELARWSDDHARRTTMRFWGGTIVPKAQVQSIRSWGWPYTEREEVCSIHFEVRTPPISPGQERFDDIESAVQQELEDLVARTVVAPHRATVTRVDAHAGYLLDELDPLVGVLNEAHVRVHGSRPEPPVPPQVSMWHDTNAYLAAGIPAISYGVRVQVEDRTMEGRRGVLVPDAVALAQVYAIAAAAVCGSAGRHAAEVFPGSGQPQR